MAGRIDVYIDVSSFYSYVAYQQLLGLKPSLEQHGVTVELIPVFLGAINNGSGNKPPWTVPAKAIYGRFDALRAAKAAGLKDISFPKDLMAVGNTVVPLRALHYIKRNHPAAAYYAVWENFFQAFWGSNKRNLSNPEQLAEVLGGIPAGPGSSQPLFPKAEIEKIVAATKSEEYKDIVRATVKEALDQGAFGAPWLWVTNSKGKSEPFFGSDRWHHVYEFLGLPYQKAALLPQGTPKAASAKI